ncbi:20093_t:CDS:2 [Dentiscutata erythropus]|uniref:Nucleolar protein 12 n=1 Tax=Dentiscutata erythropus TaxID=1348616 RepID=A0A9N9NIR1_9GLOM|nr:20093_t:CDS:2 [Dentiscutata erythropus]
MSEYVPGSLAQSLLKKQAPSIDNELDILFQNNIGQAKSKINLEEKTVTNTKSHTKNHTIIEENSEIGRKRKKKKTLKNISHDGGIQVDSSESKKEGGFKKKSIEELYEMKLVEESENRKRSEEKTNPSNNKKVSEDNELDNMRAEKRIKATIHGTKDENGKIKTTNNSTEITTKEKEDPERLQKTIFIGNLPVCVIKKANSKKLKVYFSRFGRIESIRFRSISFSEQLPRRIAFINKKLHPERDVLNAYIVFKEKSSVQGALSMNSQIFMGKHLRVDSVADPQNHDRRRSIFIGNLSFDAEEEMLWNHFENCGEIENVRIIRDSKTNVGKGIAYVQFKQRSSVELALKLNDTKIGTRNIRVSRCAKTKQIDTGKRSFGIRAHGKKNGR